jgi:hypothetical protein
MLYVTRIRYVVGHFTRPKHIISREVSASCPTTPAIQPVRGHTYFILRCLPFLSHCSRCSSPHPEPVSSSQYFMNIWSKCVTFHAPVSVLSVRFVCSTTPLCKAPFSTVPFATLRCKRLAPASTVKFARLISSGFRNATVGQPGKKSVDPDPCHKAEREDSACHKAEREDSACFPVLNLHDDMLRLLCRCELLKRQCVASSMKSEKSLTEIVRGDLTRADVKLVVPAVVPLGPLQLFVIPDQTGCCNVSVCDVRSIPRRRDSGSSKLDTNGAGTRDLVVGLLISVSS